MGEPGVDTDLRVEVVESRTKKLVEPLGLESPRDTTVDEPSSIALDVAEEGRCMSLWNIGFLLGMCFGLLMSIASAMVKEMGAYFPALTALYRFGVMFLCTAPITAMAKNNPFPVGYRVSLLLRSFSGCVNITLRFFALWYLPLGDAVVIAYTTPIFVMVFARFLLKEPCGVLHIVAAFICLTGITLIAKPSAIFGGEDPKEGQIYGFVAGFVAAGFNSISLITTRQMKDVHFSVICLNFFFFSVAIDMVVVFSFGEFSWPRTLMDGLLFFGIGFLSWAAQMCNTIGVQLADAGSVSIARTLEVVFAFIWQVAYFQQTPSVVGGMGAVMVLCSSLMIGTRTMLQKRLPPGSKCRRIFFGE